jgi:hypothetical protein
MLRPIQKNGASAHPSPPAPAALQCHQARPDIADTRDTKERKSARRQVFVEMNVKVNQSGNEPLTGGIDKGRTGGNSDSTTRTRHHNSSVSD